jgi:hypothetical protein
LNVLKFVPGSEYHVPGIGQVTNTAPVASQAQYIFHNKVQLAGFTVVMSLGRSDKLNEGFNFAYHVDKVTRDSMALTPGPVAAQTYYDDKLKIELKTTHRLEIESPTRIAAYSPALETAEDDKHVIRVEIGKAPEVRCYFTVFIFNDLSRQLAPFQRPRECFVLLTTRTLLT